MKKIIICLSLFFIYHSVLFSEEWHVRKSSENIVKFISSTPVLDFEGITSKIDGYIYWEGDEIFGEKNEIYFEVDLNSVETGIGKRDRDMREDVLETDKWPKTSFKGTIQNFSESEDEFNSYKIASVGKMFLHGKEKDLKVYSTISFDNNIMHVVCNFLVFLNDYEIEAPTLLAFIKVAQEIKLELNFQLEKIEEDEN